MNIYDTGPLREFCHISCALQICSGQNKKQGNYSELNKVYENVNRSNGMNAEKRILF